MSNFAGSLRAACALLPVENKTLITACLSVCQMNAEPGTVKKWKVADISRVVADGVEVDVRRLANEFVRPDGEPVQLVLEFLEDPMAQRKANARRTARRSHGLRPAGASEASHSARSCLGML